MSDKITINHHLPNTQGIIQRQMIICENEPAELPQGVVRCDTKVDDGLDNINVNLNNILERFERGITNNGEENQPSSAGLVFEKPSFNIKKTLMAFESKLVNNDEDANLSKNNGVANERSVVRKLNINGFLNNQSKTCTNGVTTAPVKPLAVRRSESLIARLKKYESRIAGEQVDDDDENEESDGNDSNEKDEDYLSDLSQRDNSPDDRSVSAESKGTKSGIRRAKSPKKLTSFNLSSLKSQWESGDISNRRDNEDDNEKLQDANSTGDESNCNGNSPLAEKNEELFRVRQQMARKKSGQSGSVRNIYENAIREAQQQQLATRRVSSDISTLNGLSTNEIQQQLLQNSLNGGRNHTNNSRSSPPSKKDQFQLNLSNKANKLKEKFELGLINNSSHDDSDQSDDEENRAMTKLEQLRQEKMESLSVFTDGEIKAREARSMFQQIDKQISAESGVLPKPVLKTRSLAQIGTRMKLNNRTTNGLRNNISSTNNNQNHNKHDDYHQNNNDIQPQPNVAV